MEEINIHECEIGICSDPSINFHFTGSVLCDPVKLSLSHLYYYGWKERYVENKWYEEIIAECQAIIKRNNERNNASKK